MFDLAPGNLTDAFVQTLCLAVWIGGPFIAWGLLLIFNRDGTWRAQEVRAAKQNKVIERTPQWDRWQLVRGGSLVAIGVLALIVITAFVYAGYITYFENLPPIA